MKGNENVLAVLNDLIKINNDRIEGYEKAADNIEQDEVTLRTLFVQLSEESREYREQLSEKVRDLGSDPVIASTLRGKLYRAWMDVHASFSGNDAESTLSACEFGEDATQKAYKDALEDDTDFPDDILQLITSQKDQLKLSHDLIRNQRNQFIHH